MRPCFQSIVSCKALELSGCSFFLHIPPIYPQAKQLPSPLLQLLAMYMANFAVVLEQQGAEREAELDYLTRTAAELWSQQQADATAHPAGAVAARGKGAHGKSAFNQALR